MTAARALPKADRDPVRFSLLKNMGKSAAHYLDALTRQRDTPSLKKGRALHSYLLGDTGSVVVYGGRRDERTAEYRQFLADNPGKEILIASELETVQGMRDSLERNSEAIDLLQGTVEKRMFWNWLGRECAGTPDVRTPRRVVELKTCRCADPDRFKWDALRFSYHAQLAFYRLGMIESGFGTPTEHLIVAVESAPPYPVTILRLTERTIDLGERACRLWLERLLVCEAFDRWPAYCESVVELELANDSEEMLGEEEEIDDE